MPKANDKHTTSPQFSVSAFAAGLNDPVIPTTPLALYYADKLDGADFDEETVKDVASDLLTLLSSIILVLVKAGNLDIDRLGWGEMRNLTALHAPGAETVA